MRIDEWDARYRNGECAEDRSTTPTRLVVETAQKLAPGKALDLACGAGRNAIWLASQGWDVTAIDGSSAAIEILNERAREQGVEVRTRVADLEKSDFSIQPDSWDLITKCYYLQRSLIPAVKAGVRPGGTAIVIVHLANPGDEITHKRAAPGELRSFFEDWEILHYYEGRPNDSEHRRAVAELAAHKRS